MRCIQSIAVYITRNITIISPTLTNSWYFCYEYSSHGVCHTDNKSTSDCIIKWLPQVSSFHCKLDILVANFTYSHYWIVSIWHIELVVKGLNYKNGLIILYRKYRMT